MRPSISRVSDCEDEGLGLSIVDVLRATGEHGTFLRLTLEHDPEGFAILADPELADKTVWAPTDAAFVEIGETLSSLSEDEITDVLGYHVTPPRRTPEGPYPIVTPRFLAEGGEVVHQTRTGILTGSDQRVRTRVEGGVLTVEDAVILPTSWCTQTGSVFSIDAVILDASPPSLVERVVYVVFLRYPWVALVGLGAAVGGAILLRRTRRRGFGPPA
ncbi:MAG: fasciclin domain-containing protein [Trueperaceae bacterium]